MAEAIRILQVPPGIARTSEEVRGRFERLWEELRTQTQYESNYSRVLLHPAYRGILGLGPLAVPLILEKIRKGSRGVWFQTLEDIVEHNPVAKEHEMDVELMAQDWLKWGRDNGLL